MNVPKEGPLGVELLVHEDGAFLTVEEEAPFWQFWKVTRRCTVLLNRWGLIWLYQAIAKAMGRRVQDASFEELSYDLRAALTVYDEVFSHGLDDANLERIAAMLRAKGWVKV